MKNIALKALLWTTLIALAAPMALAEATASPEPAPTLPPAPGYVLVTAGGQSGWLPLPEEGEYTYHLRQILPDGTVADNAVHLSPEGVYMEDATCDNHDCVQQGEVTFDNREDRILGSMIICLPNQVMLELFSVDEAMAMIAGK